MLEQKTSSRSRVKIAVFCVLAIHVVGLLALLLQGCKREQAAAPVDNTQLPVVTETNLPAMDTNAPPAADTNAVVAPPVAPPVPAVTEHTIAKGDTLSGLAAKYHVSLKALEAANPNVNPNKLQINQKIVIPAPAAADSGTSPAASVPASMASEQIYSVKNGDTLTKIAANFKTSVKAIRAANNLTTDRITVGQKLKIPVKVAAPVDSAPAPAPATANPAPSV